MIMRKLANTNFMSWKATENVSESPEVAVVTGENPLSEDIA